MDPDKFFDRIHDKLHSMKLTTKNKMHHLKCRGKAGFKVLTGCLKKELKNLPTEVSQLLLDCLPSAAAGPPGFGACVASKAIVDAIKATAHVTACIVPDANVPPPA